jgi:hypothetical protein
VDAKPLEKLVVKGEQLPILAYEVAGLSSEFAHLEKPVSNLPQKQVKIKKSGYAERTIGVHIGVLH